MLWRFLARRRRVLIALLVPLAAFASVDVHRSPLPGQRAARGGGRGRRRAAAGRSDGGLLLARRPRGSRFRRLGGPSRERGVAPGNRAAATGGPGEPRARRRGRAAGAAARLPRGHRLQDDRRRRHRARRQRLVPDDPHRPGFLRRCRAPAGGPRSRRGCRTGDQGFSAFRARPAGHRSLLGHRRDRAADPRPGGCSGARRVRVASSSTSTGPRRSRSATTSSPPAWGGDSRKGSGSARSAGSTAAATFSRVSMCARRRAWIVSRRSGW